MKRSDEEQQRHTDRLWRARMLATEVRDEIRMAMITAPYQVPGALVEQARALYALVDTLWKETRG